VRRLLEVSAGSEGATAEAKVGEAREPVPGGAPPGGPAPAAAAEAAPAATTQGLPAKFATLAFPVAIVVAVVALGVVLVLFPRGSRGSPTPLTGVSRARTGPLLGPGTPGVGDGARTWVVPGDQRGALLGLLVDALSLRHAVLLAIADSAPLPPFQPGPVYRSAGAPADVFREAAALSAPGRPVVVVIVPPPGRSATDWPAARDEVEVLAVLADVPDGADVVAAWEGSGWRLRTRQGEAWLADSAGVGGSGKLGR
jgi:hypothetical protein